jgi:exodeoxyribonuclease VII large subunit
MNELAPPPVSNIPEYTVSEISGAVKRTLETTFNRVRVRGEITELKRYPSGHIYFSLKDEGAKLAGVVWKTSVPRLGMVPENGVEVIATGRISSYGERSSYQLIVERMQYAGAGALLARIEALRVRLAAEGLFDSDRKRPLPALPRLVGVVTSEQGAVLQDIRTTIARRFPRDILLWPVPVQGEGAAEQIAAAIEGIVKAVPRPDVLIVGRGGGSLEDLMAFNEEIVVRAVARCPIPVIAAVGHETDTTLVDFAADRRAPTPTAAAEMAVPSRADLVADLLQRSSRLVGAVRRQTQEQHLRLSHAGRALPDLPGLVGSARQRLDDRSERLRLAWPNLLDRCHASLDGLGRRLPDLHAWVATSRERLDTREQRLALAMPALIAGRRAELDSRSHQLTACLRHSVAAIHGRAVRALTRVSAAPVQGRLRELRARLGGAAAQLESVSPLAVLNRGYALVRDAAGHAVTSVAGVRPGEPIRIRFADGEVGAHVDRGSERERQGQLPL